MGVWNKERVLKKNSVMISSGWAKGMGLVTPEDLRTRPTASRVREAVFSSLAPVVDGCCFLDVFAGSGAMGIEAASRGASLVVFLEGDPTVTQLLRKNLVELRRRASAQHLKEGRYEILEGDISGLWTDTPARSAQRTAKEGGAERQFSRLDLGRLRALAPFDFVYIDPPYSLAAGIAPFLLGSLEGYLSPDAHLAFETNSGQDGALVQEFVESSQIYDLIQVKKYGVAAVTFFKRKGAS
jgi:16S rRNA G966 N2-methylase RsmD